MVTSHDAIHTTDQTYAHQASARVRLEEAIDIATDAYVYAFPFVLMDVSRRICTNVEHPAPNLRAPSNQFAHAREFPTSAAAGVVRPNVDTLSSSLWLDLTREPIVVSVPNADGRYFSLPMHDLWTNVFAAPGSRTTGAREQRFAVVGPDWRGSLPGGIDEIRSPTTHAWLWGQTQTNGSEDYAAVHRFQDGLIAMPLSQSRSFAKPAKGRVNPDIDMKPALDQVAKMSGLTFFSHFLHTSKTDQPHIEDSPILARMKRLGLEPGKGCDFEALPLSVKSAIHDAPKSAMARIAHQHDDGRNANGWSIPVNPLGTYGTDYLKRARVAFLGLGADTIDDIIHAIYDERSSREALDSNSSYVLHFEPPEIAPVKGFWSLTLYNQRKIFATNALGRHALGSRDPLTLNPNGSLDIYLQRDDPGADRRSNWLPTPQHGPFSLSLRLYWPRNTAISGAWSPPAPVRMPR